MKTCLREGCSNEFEPNKPKQKFCSDKCRVYYGRQKAKKISEIQEDPIWEEFKRWKESHLKNKSVDIPSAPKIKKENTAVEQPAETLTSPQFKNKLERIMWEKRQQINTKNGKEKSN